MVVEPPAEHRFEPTATAEAGRRRGLKVKQPVTEEEDEDDIDAGFSPGMKAIRRAQRAKKKREAEEKAAKEAAAAAIPKPAAPLSPEHQEFNDQILERAEKLDSLNLFQVLGLDQSAEESQIQKAYLDAARKWHPDRLPKELAHVKQQVSKIFARMNEAQRTLINEGSRAEYLERLAAGGGTPEDEAKVSRLVDAAMEFQKSEVMLKTGDLRGAQQLARKAHEADPDQPEYAALLAWVDAQLKGPAAEGDTKHYDKEIRILSKIIKEEKEFEKAIFWRGTLLKQCGQMEAAMKDFHRVVKLNPRNLDAAREIRVFEMRGGKKKKKGWGGLFGG
jgi:tetratricopeptide (TPR) repeat protein